MATTISGTTITFNDGTTQTTTGIEFASGTVMMFRQTAAPTGWTKDTTNYNDHALRVVTGTVGSGGSVDFSTAMASKSVTGSVSISGGSVSATTLDSSTMPSHNHYSGTYFIHDMGAPAFGTVDGAGRSDPAGRWQGYATTYRHYTSSSGSSGSHSHGFTNPSGSFSGNAINMAVKYCDVIFATKN